MKRKIVAFVLLFSLVLLGIPAAVGAVPMEIARPPLIRPVPNFDFKPISPMFLQDLRHSGQSSYTGPLSNIKLKWKTPYIGEFFSSPVIGWDGTIYIGGYYGGLYAFDPANGSVKWKCPTGNIQSAPAIGADGTIYIGSMDKNFYAVSSAGELLWKYNTGASIDCSPTIGIDETIYFGNNNGTFYAFNPDGSLKWQYATGGRTITCSPVIGTDDSIYVGTWNNQLFAFTPDGTVRTQFAQAKSVNDSLAMAKDGTIYAGASDNYLYAYTDNGAVKWKYKIGDPNNIWPKITSSPAIGMDGTIYIGSADGILYAVKPDGTRKWEFTAGGSIDSSAAIGADGTIYVGSTDNKMYALNPTDGTVRWQYATGNKIYSSPAIAPDGTLYFGSNDCSFYAIDSLLPSMPTQLAGTVKSATEVSLSWRDNASNESGYKIERRTANGSYAEVGTAAANSTSFTNSGLTVGTLYTYRVMAYNSAGNSPYSNEFRIMPDIAPAAAPSNLAAAVQSPTEVNLTWQDNTSNETGFYIERRREGEVFKSVNTLPANVTTFTDTGLMPGTAYYYKVAAYNFQGKSPYSNEVKVVTTAALPVPPVPGQAGPQANELRLYIGKSTYSVNNEDRVMDVSPVLRESRTMLPIRYIAEPLGASVGWDDAEQKVTIIRGARTIELWINNPIAHVDGKDVYIDPGNHKVVPLVLPPGRTMLPVRFIAENLNCQVGWDETTGEVKVICQTPG